MKRIKTHKIKKTRHHCWPHTKEEGYNLGWTSRFYIYTRRLQKLSLLSYTNPYSHGQDATAAFRRSWYLAWLTCACLLMKELAIPQNIQDNLTTMKYTFLRLEYWTCCFCHFYPLYLHPNGIFTTGIFQIRSPPNPERATPIKTLTRYILELFRVLSANLLCLTQKESSFLTYTLSY